MNNKEKPKQNLTNQHICIFPLHFVAILLHPPSIHLLVPFFVRETNRRRAFLTGAGAPGSTVGRTFGLLIHITLVRETACGSLAHLLRAPRGSSVVRSPSSSQIKCFDPEISSITLVRRADIWSPDSHHPRQRNSLWFARPSPSSASRQLGGSIPFFESGDPGISANSLLHLAESNEMMKGVATQLSGTTIMPSPTFMWRFKKKEEEIYNFYKLLPVTAKVPSAECRPFTDISNWINTTLYQNLTKTWLISPWPCWTALHLGPTVWARITTPPLERRLVLKTECRKLNMDQIILASFSGRPSHWTNISSVCDDPLCFQQLAITAHGFTENSKEFVIGGGIPQITICCPCTGLIKDT
ncbi:LOW QUALITY PROTEIN: hypothetical protein V2J09_004435 [Rumex salicifolius]